jgi:hypothetical protein
MSVVAIVDARPWAHGAHERAMTDVGVDENFE